MRRNPLPVVRHIKQQERQRHERTQCRQQNRPRRDVCFALIELREHERAGASRQRSKQDSHLDERQRQHEHARSKPPGQYRLQQEF
jgi:hypothetical protein